MSVENALKFMEAAAQDPDLRMRVGALSGPDTLSRLAEIAAEAGYSFTEAEYREAVAQTADGELDDEALDEAARQMGLKE